MKPIAAMLVGLVLLAALLAAPFLLLFGTDDLTTNAIGALALIGLMFP